MGSLYEGLGVVDSARTRRSRRTIPKRHPAEVTSDRLADAGTRWYEKLTGEERDMIGQLRVALQAIADGER